MAANFGNAFAQQKETRRQKDEHDKNLATYTTQMKEEIKSLKQHGHISTMGSEERAYNAAVENQRKARDMVDMTKASLETARQKYAARTRAEGLEAIDATNEIRDWRNAAREYLERQAAAQAQQEGEKTETPRSTMSYFIGKDVEFSSQDVRSDLAMGRVSAGGAPPLPMQSLKLASGGSFSRLRRRMRGKGRKDNLRCQETNRTSSTTAMTQPAEYVSRQQESLRPCEGIIFSGEGTMAPTRFGGYATRGRGKVIKGGGHVSQYGMLGGIRQWDRENAGFMLGGEDGRDSGSEYRVVSIGSASASMLSPLAASFVPHGASAEAGTPVSTEELVRVRVERLEKEVAELREEVVMLKGQKGN